MRALPVLLVIVLAGCLNTGPPEPPAFAEAVFGEGTATGGEHAKGTPEASAVVVTRQGDTWRATKEVRLSGTTGDHEHLRVALKSFNGDVAATHAGDDYLFVVDAYGYGPTAAAARQALDNIRITFQHRVDDELRIGATARTLERFDSKLGGGASITATLPSGPSSVVRVDTSNGEIALAGHRGPGAFLDTSNGEVGYSGETDVLWVDTSNGEITIVGGIVHLEADTSNGEIDANLRPVRSGSHTFDTSNGEVHVAYAEGASYDVVASTSNDEARIMIPNGQNIGDQSDDEKHVRSADWDSAETKIKVFVDSSNADVLVTA